jgi:hypothetical protein
MEKLPLKNVFIKKIPLNLLVELLDKICSRMEGRGIENGVRVYYYISEYEYRKMIFEHLEVDFLKSIRPYYSNFFSHYCERDFTYNSFKTIVRQICKIHGIRYEKEKVILNSETVVRYCIYVSDLSNSGLLVDSVMGV